jgi:hypothetical protein
MTLERERDEALAQRDNLLDASKEGAWMARALDAERERDEQEDGLRHGEQVCARLVAERDEALAQVARREREHEALLETAQKALAQERDDFRIVVGERDIAEAALCRVRRDAATEVAQRIAAEYRAVVAERERDALREALQQAILEGK